MSRVPDERSLSQLSIPGTHDTCALRNGASFGFAKCQSWGLEDQLEAGIRFIDIRCRHVGDSFHIYHGIVDQKITFAKVQDVCRAFLKQYPTECIVMSVKKEHKPTNNSRSFEETFAAETKTHRQLWHIDKKIPNLKQARGRIVLVDRVGRLGGVQWRTFAIQDDYQAKPGDKAKLIRKHLKTAAEGNNGKWFINFCSGTYPSKLITPARYAETSNRVAFEHLIDLKRTPVLLGTLAMDFPGEELIGRIVETNFDSREADR